MFGLKRQKRHISILSSLRRDSRTRNTLIIFFLFSFFSYAIYFISIIFHVLISFACDDQKTKMKKFSTLLRNIVLSNIIEIVTSFPRIFIPFPPFPPFSSFYCRTVLFHCLPLLCFPSCFCCVVAFRLVVRFLFLHRLVFFSTVSTAFSLPFLFPPIPIRAPRPFLPFSIISFLLFLLPFPFSSRHFFSLSTRDTTRGLHPSHHRDNENGRLRALRSIGHSINWNTRFKSRQWDNRRHAPLRFARKILCPINFFDF